MGAVLLSLLLLAFTADIRGCVCDAAKPETMASRECALAKIARDDHAPAKVLFIPDANPTKPNRTLAIPHVFRRTLNDMSDAERAVYWSAAIEKARALWGGKWGIAVNGEEKRSQCQMHAHIGKLLDESPDRAADAASGVLVDRVEDIPVPPAGTGILIHPEGGKLRVLVGVPAPELDLMR